MVNCFNWAVLWLDLNDDEDANERTKDDGSDDIRAGPHLHDCPLCKQSVKSADHKHSSLSALTSSAASSSPPAPS